MNYRQNLSRKKESYRDSNDLLHSKYQTTLNKQYHKQTGIQQSFEFYSNFMNKNYSSVLFKLNDTIPCITNVVNRANNIIILKPKLILYNNANFLFVHYLIHCLMHF